MQTENVWSVWSDFLLTKPGSWRGQFWIGWAEKFRNSCLRRRRQIQTQELFFNTVNDETVTHGEISKEFTLPLEFRFGCVLCDFCFLSFSFFVVFIFVPLVPPYMIYSSKKSQRCCLARLSSPQTPPSLWLRSVWTSSAVTLYPCLK